MKNRIGELIEEVNSFEAISEKELEQFRNKFLSKKGIIPALFSDLKSVDETLRRETGILLNNLKELANRKLLEQKEKLSASQKSLSHRTEADLTMPVDFSLTGARHPLSIVRNEIIHIFTRIGYVIAEGPEIEDDWHNFTALNFPQDHPARDMQDTFFIEMNPEILLRTHTSTVQVRVMENANPPIRVVCPGRVYRNEAISARAHCLFHQIEGLYIDRNVSFADLKQTLVYFAKEMFGTETSIRLRPSYFPFTEPSAEMDISCSVCKGKGCNICKHTGWVEILGCGMVDPYVLENCKINSREFTGFAFGMGIERVALLKYEIKDLRLFYENDIRFLKQFISAGR